MTARSAFLQPKTNRAEQHRPDAHSTPFQPSQLVLVKVRLFMSGHER